MSGEDRVHERPPAPGRDPWDALLAGYRFRLAETPETAAAALDVRRQVYSQKVGEPIPVPDEFDERCWLLAAEHAETGRVVGTMRAAPRDRGPFECERFFDLPPRLLQGTSIEISRFAVLADHRRKPDSLPPVSLGLFRLVLSVCRRANADWVVIASREEQVGTYEWLGFHRTGVVASYGSLAGAEHELLWKDFRQTGGYEWHALREFFAEERESIILPGALPEPGAWLARLPGARAAAAGRVS